MYKNIQKSIAILFVILFCIITGNTNAQTIEDTTLADGYNRKAKLLKNEAKYDSSNYYFNKACLIYEKENKWTKYINAKNNIGDNLRGLSKYQEALKLLSATYSIGIEKIGKNNMAIAQTLSDIGRVYINNSNYEKALNSFKGALAIVIKIKGENSNNTAKIYGNIGVIYEFQSKFKDAIEYYKKALNIALLQGGENNTIVATTYLNIGNVYYNIGENENALLYQKKALDIRRKILNENDPEIGRSYYNVGLIYMQIGRYNEALEFYNKSIENFKRAKLSPFHENFGYVYNDIGVLYDALKNYNEAIKYLEEALKIRRKIYKNNNVLIGVSMGYLGIVNNSIGNFEKAIEWHNQSILIWNEIFDKKNSYSGVSYEKIALIFLKQQKYAKSLAYCQKSIISFIDGFDDNNANSNPKLSEVKIQDKRRLLRSLKLKGQIYRKLYLSTNNIEDLQKSISAYYLAVELIDKLNDEYKFESSKIFLRRQAHVIYSRTIKVLQKLFAITNNPQIIQEAFLLSEKNLSNVLLGSLVDSHSKLLANIPEKLLLKEEHIKDSLAFYNLQMVKESNTKEAVSNKKVEVLQNKLFTLNREHQILISKFEKDYPQYYELKYVNTIIDIETLRNKLDENTLLFEYFKSDSTLFIFTITQNSYDVKSVSIDSTFNKSIKNIIASLKTGEFYEFAEANRVLHKILIEPIKNELVGKTKLVIVPDGILNKVPFEILFEPNEEISKQENYKYLVNNFEISYSPSATLYYNSKNKKDNFEKTNFADLSFIGIAPIFASNNKNGIIAENTLRSLDTISYRSFTDLRGNLLELAYSKEEINNINTLFTGKKKVLTNKAATESNFKNEINNNSYNVVHISTHGLANETKPELSCFAFSQPNDSLSKEDGFLFSGETYNLNLQETDLLVLSACESGVGKIAKGEGMLSLTRGFLYAGANNILYSLWKINDKFTSEFMTLFYKKMIEDNLTYSSALKEAKTEMIKKGAFPGLWGAFVLVEN